MAENPSASPDTAEVDWPEKAADEIITRVGQVRDKTTGPALKIARAVVYGIAIVCIALFIGVLSAILLVRVLDIALENAIGGDDHTWLAHSLVGIIFLVGGLFAWSKRTASD